LSYGFFAGPNIACQKINADGQVCSNLYRKQMGGSSSESKKPLNNCRGNP
jgi:hypothetical protein